MNEALKKCFRKLFSFIDNYLLDLTKERLFLFKWMFPKRFRQYIRKLSQKLTNHVDRFLAYGDSHLVIEHNNSIYHVDNNEDELDAAGDYLATFTNMRDALREQGFEPNERIFIHPRGSGRLTLPLIEGRIDENGNYEFSTRVQINAQDVDRWQRQEELLRDRCEIECNTQPPRKNLMDRKYPHVCFECHSELQYKHAFNQACEKYSLPKNYYYNIKKDIPILEGKLFFSIAKKHYDLGKQFRVWWRSPLVKFLCCNCFKKESYYGFERILENAP